MIRKPLTLRTTLFGCLILTLGCSHSLGGLGDGVNAPGLDISQTAEDALQVGHRLLAANEYELAMRSFSRAALALGETNAEILLGMGTANLGLGRLNQAESLLRLALEKENDWAEVYNNLGVVLMEKGQPLEAAEMFRKAFALDDGQSDQVRNNLSLALSNSPNSDTIAQNNNDYKLVRRGRNDYLIRQNQ
ncbi:MAG: tetratricopeptide repeat protein [Paracoccaceae bacterium]